MSWTSISFGGDDDLHSVYCGEQLVCSCVNHNFKVTNKQISFRATSEAMLRGPTNTETEAFAELSGEEITLI